jgi:hypothetical protein
MNQESYRDSGSSGSTVEDSDFRTALSPTPRGPHQNTAGAYTSPATAEQSHPQYGQNSHTQAPIQTTPISPTGPTHSAPQRTGHGLSNTIRGIRGASEALRGTVNMGIAKGVRNAEEEARMREIRNEGMQDFRDSGLREGFRTKAGERQRERRRSRDGTGNVGVYGSEGPGGLDPVEERSIRSMESR